MALAEITPPTRHAKRKPLSKKSDIVVIPPVEGQKQLSPKKGKRRTKAFNTIELHPRKAEPRKISKITQSVSKKAKNPSRKDKKEASKKAQKRAIPAFDGQPRYEGGMRFYQGGLPELGKR